MTCSNLKPKHEILTQQWDKKSTKKSLKNKFTEIKLIKISKQCTNIYSHNFKLR